MTTNTGLTVVNITMPCWMLEELRARARQRGITVTELIRRSVFLDRMLFDNPENEVVLRRRPIRTAEGSERLADTLEDLGASEAVVEAARRGDDT